MSELPPFTPEIPSSSKEVMRSILDKPDLGQLFIGDRKLLLTEEKGVGKVGFFSVSDAGDFLWFVLGNKPCLAFGDGKVADDLYQIVSYWRPGVTRADALIADAWTGELVISKGCILYDPSLVQQVVAKSKDLLKKMGISDQVLQVPDVLVADIFSRGTSDFSEPRISQQERKGSLSIPEQSYAVLGLLYGYPLTDSIVMDIQRHPQLYSSLNLYLEQRNIRVSLDQIQRLNTRSEHVKLYGEVETGWITFDLAPESRELAHSIQRRLAASGIIEVIKEKSKEYLRISLMQRLHHALLQKLGKEESMEYRSSKSQN